MAIVHWAFPPYFFFFFQRRGTFFPAWLKPFFFLRDFWATVAWSIRSFPEVPFPPLPLPDFLFFSKSLCFCAPADEPRCRRISSGVPPADSPLSMPVRIKSAQSNFSLVIFWSPGARHFHPITPPFSAMCFFQSFFLFSKIRNFLPRYSFYAIHAGLFRASAFFL